jgi:predicted metal-dependent phosphoesterase TrpH
MRHLIGEFRELGGVGIEVISGSHSRDEACRLCPAGPASIRLLASAGSDYHGPEHPYMELGRLPNLPPSCAPIWADW